MVSRIYMVKFVIHRQIWNVQFPYIRVNLHVQNQKCFSDIFESLLFFIQQSQKAEKKVRKDFLTLNILELHKQIFSYYNYKQKSIPLYFES